LRQSFPPLDFVDLISEEIYANLDEAEEDANDAVERHEDEQGDVKVHFYIDQIVVLRREASE